MNIIEEINRFKKEKKAVILAHYYTRPEIQDISDYLGDSLALAQYAQKTKADVIVFAGVYFMAETAKILNPTKRVFLPDFESKCSLADSCLSNDFKAFKDKYPDYKVVSYINSSADIKILSDVICTSSNAKKIIQSFDKNEKIIFAPDRNLGNYLNNELGVNMLLWDGACHVHDTLKVEQLIEIKKTYPYAKVIAHPECKQLILEFADFIGSTTALIQYVKQSNDTTFIVATETGILHEMRKQAPNKHFIIVGNAKTCECNDCEYMKLNTLEKIYRCLVEENNEILLSQEIIDKAKSSIVRMLELS
ncbi:MAG: quinolinate synthase NadA [Bacteroidales bacterium]|jgi:quinolinate synthase|nr:quinolinate synthase NadA [Bacteroidales bacterium]MDD3690858.1 quinolinate synthase NadA [Bacteroidales bacterium]MDD4044146.1 quinolinate synthase NadA [Bacteroidales bacterium]MDD4580940.1 quinolinate synthase NadA [Bacteroidales bacterium]MDX9889441.1 quinolinate synthase NadA [Bacteroidales bacterium]